MFHKIIDGIHFYLSDNSNKKYKAVLPNGRIVNFGAKGYSQYRDRIGYYSSYDHLDSKRRNRYRARHKAILTGDGRLAYKVKYSPSYFSYKYLW